MALITCPDCGREISDKAPSCPHCGCPMGDSLAFRNHETASDFVVVHGYEETFAVDVKVKVYKNDEYIGDVPAAGILKVPVDRDCDLKFKSTIRKASVHIRKGVDTNVYLSFDRFTGSLKAFTATDDNMETVKKQKEHSASKANLNSIILVVILLILALYFLTKNKIIILS